MLRTRYTPDEQRERDSQTQAEAPGKWEYQCRMTPFLDGTRADWIPVDADHNCGGELRRRRIGEWEKVEI